MPNTVLYIKTYTIRNSSLNCPEKFYPENSKSLYQIYLEKTDTARLAVVNRVTRHRRTIIFSYERYICHTIEVSIYRFTHLDTLLTYGQDASKSYFTNNPVVYITATCYWMRTSPRPMSTLVFGKETNIAKGGNVQRDTDWPLQFPVTVNKRCETSGEI
jgi:hypothetical protein